MATPQDAEYYPVQLGIWTNWSRGPVFGPTLTLRRRDGDLLIAFTALFVALVSTRGWRVVSFIFHRYYASPNPQGAVYHQHQAILRNSSNTQSSILQLAGLVWANRVDKRKIRRPFLTFLVAVVYAVAFSAAGGFSSQISTAVGTDVLIKSKNCGWNDRDLRNLPDVTFLSAAFVAEQVSNAANYAQQCYSSNTAGILDCGRLVAKKIPSQSNTQAGCPFEDGVCRDSSANLLVDSGYIDSQDFGLNTPHTEKILTRYLLHCAPIKTQGYSSRMHTTIGDITLYHYGNTTTSSGVKDYMGTAKTIESQYAYLLSDKTVQVTANYDLSPFKVRVENGVITKNRNSDFIPIDSVFRPDADLTIVLLATNGVIHTKPSSDQWYQVSPTSQNVASSDLTSSPDFTPFFLPLEDASPLGCTQQWQFCRQSTDNCSPLGSFSDSLAGAALIFNTTSDHLTSSAYNDISAAQFHYFQTVVGESPELNTILQKMGSTSLISQNSLVTSQQGPLPSNQWQIDVAHWVDIQMASLQLSFLRTVYYNPTGQFAPLLRSRRNFTSQTENSLCMSQKVKSTAHTSFSLFGLIFTYAVGFIVITASFLLEPVFWLLYRKRGHNQHATLEWTTNTTLQLQRLAHEGLGFGTWSKGTENIPVAKTGDTLGCLDYTNPNHPVLGSAPVVDQSQASISTVVEENEENN
ncbi:hypothetical protein FHL15_005449 [Xylaria flabelliformis]|uniref:Uncharacterized protein n=1 Tax=Xylaria flabelliformis TaxID=2512241 RepID=A0A553I0P0_9PEZI|nr:hypothetical protein FHL15_005449 [Xylaria flabelliformis]